MSVTRPLPEPKSAAQQRLERLLLEQGVPKFSTEDVRRLVPRDWTDEEFSMMEFERWLGETRTQGVRDL